MKRYETLGDMEMDDLGSWVLAEEAAAESAALLRRAEQAEAEVKRAWLAHQDIESALYRESAALARRTAERDRARAAVALAFRAHMLGGPKVHEIEAMLADEEVDR